MNKEQKRVLKLYQKNQLIYLIEQFHHSTFIISEICVEESKLHIKSDDAVDRIRDELYMPSRYNEKDLKAYIDMCIGKITAEEYRTIVLG